MNWNLTEQQRYDLMARVKRYYAAYEDGTLDNDPADLLCDYLADAEEYNDESVDDCLARLFLPEAIGTVGDSGALGGVNVVEDVDGVQVEYTTSHESTWLRLDALLELAIEAEETHVRAPLPRWFDPAGWGMTRAFAEQQVDALRHTEIMALLGQWQATCEDDSTSDEACHPYWWEADPRNALRGLLKDMTPQARRAFLEGSVG